MSRIYFSNSANQDFQAIIIPSGTWEWPEIWSPQARSIWDGLGSVKSAQDFYSWYKNASLGIWTAERAKVISIFFDAYATQIAAGESKDILGIAKSHDYLNSRQWDKFKAGLNWLVFLRSKDGKWTCAFNSNNNEAWISEGKDEGYQVIGARSQKVWQADPHAGQHVFDQVKTGSALPFGV